MTSFWTLQIWHAYELRHLLHWRGHGHTTLAWVLSQVIEQMGSCGRRVEMPACPRGGVGAGRMGLAVAGGDEGGGAGPDREWEAERVGARR